ncbi:unnamed protein product, partial [Mesorhabditis belari]|uniref:Uncharacterized protein n=1 Tax=Mesorhabditis belari TaxID=2138241 RepID=A0AAF3FI98_9BILA
MYNRKISLVALIFLISSTIALPVFLDNQEESELRSKRQIGWGQNNEWGRNYEMAFGLNKDMMRKMQAGPFGAMIRNEFDMDGQLKLNMHGLTQQQFQFGK